MNSIGWIYLFIAGFLEIGFTTSMKLMDGHKNIPWSIAFYVCIILSFGFLQEAIKSVPLGTAYAVWTGIGAAGTFIIGVLFFNDPSIILRWIGVSLIILGVIFLKAA
jgi:quaternary ammonium compound-resistance protein SugE